MSSPHVAAALGESAPVTAQRSPGGLAASLRRLFGTLVETAEVRLELVGPELEREKLRVARGLLLAAAPAVLCMVSLMLLSAAVVMLADAATRLAVVFGLGAAYASLAAWLLHAARSVLRAPPGGAFALSSAELRRDLEAMRPSPA